MIDYNKQQTDRISGTLQTISHRGNKYEKGTYRTIEKISNGT